MTNRTHSQAEYYLHKAVVIFIRQHYPDVVWRTDLGGVRLTTGLAVKVAAIQSKIKYPDLFFAEPRGQYYGLYIELKISPEEIYTLSGQLIQDAHIQGQFAVLQMLRERGYRAEWGLGYEHTTALIEQYFRQPRPLPLKKSKSNLRVHATGGAPMT